MQTVCIERAVDTSTVMFAQNLVPCPCPCTLPVDMVVWFLTPASKPVLVNDCTRGVVASCVFFGSAVALRDPLGDTKAHQTEFIQNVALITQGRLTNTR